MELLYLDYNCYQRPFDDPQDARIQMEALACLEIFSRADAGNAVLVWSFMHDDEAAACPFPERRLETLRLSTLCEVRQGPDESIREQAHELAAHRIAPKDALHVAAALASGATHFITCDDRLAARALRGKLDIAVMNPVDYVRNLQR